ncbi:LLM class flavin-dependent oxidoreductase [Corynebacterium phoceense]|uniref:LLM class flavin-dependent oxidoreductase n=1 Tax=Corynebacterium phoceense TaxID=1686286 RepID=UPI00211B8136|nr:LLM class flavin-dependent oxidoreductase [Corynebacterium phoceense]MCQ9331072.1 LLM class flavin-dependent oxidoreductase [Corynebacterium phoceense]MCQ9339907.1 LLM class flavin-dependent oxidoreductase [Corynebacterium phoceense]MCQ9347470.1 LLM class flavin-dependent oxidoreductase [Corynebacterium phoceense]
MKAFGFLSFGHYAFGGTRGPSAEKMAKIHLELSQAADEIGVNNASFRVHHFVPQASAPMPLLGAIAGSTKHIEVGTGVIDMRYENPLYLAEEAAALYQLSGGRVALGVSRGAPEVADRGWEAFGYKGEAPNGADVARAHFEKFLEAIQGYGFAHAAPLERQYPQMFQPGSGLPVFPHAPKLRKHIFYGSGTHASAAQAAQDGVNLMSSTLVSETTANTLGEVQVQQINAYREAWKEAGHDWAPRISVSRSIFPIVDGADAQMFGMQASGHDQVGALPDAGNSIFGRTYAAEPDKLIEQLKADPAIAAADTLLITVPTGMGVDVNVKILENFATHVAPALGWKPNTEGPVTGYPID